ncbi:MAG TPA: response regulator [Enterovirga sp.]|jgi:CheY-like chemotaxis protein
MAKILYIEDNEMNRDMLSRRLQRQGFEVLTAVNGPEGVAMAEELMPDLILMDINLGDAQMDGWDATRLIKARASTAAIPIMPLTAHALTSDRDKSVELGCCDFDTKPIDLPRLVGKIKAALDNSVTASKAA